MKGGPVTLTFYSDAAYYGGAEVYISMLAKHLDADRFRLNALLPGDPPLERLEAELKEAGVTIRRHSKPGFRWWDAIRHLREDFRELGGEVLHINLPSTYDASLSSVALAAKAVGYKRVVTTEHLPMIKRRYKRFPAKLLFSEALDLILVPSYATREYVVGLHRMPWEKTTVVPYGVEEPPPLDPGVAAELRALTDTKDGMLTLGIVGRLHPRKGHRDLFEALTLLREGGKLPPLRLWVIGEGEDGEALERIVAEKNLRDIVRFVGPRSDAAALMPLLDLLLVPSHVETTPFVILEAMAAGRPVVASRIFGIPEMIEEGESGSLINPGHPADLARAMLPLLLDSELRDRFGKRARERFEEQFSADRMARTTEKIYLNDRNGTGGHE